MKLKIFLATMFALISVNGALAADHFSLGTAAYTKSDFAKAKLEYQLALKAKPANWQAQYQLANTLLALKDTAGAETAYRACLKMKPTAEIIQHCQTAITFLTTPRPAPLPPPINHGTTGTTSASSSSSHSSSGSADDAKLAAMEARKQAIQNDEKRQLAKIKAEEEEAVAAGNAGSSHRWRNIQTGERSVHMTEDEKLGITQEYEDRIRRLREDTQRRLESVTQP